MDENPTTPPRVSQLTITNQVATAVNDTLTRVAPLVQIWAGEIGPHNGGTVPCDHTMMRWANFADSHWYLDAMGVKAASGYSVFCRQDFVGIDYVETWDFFFCFFLFTCGSSRPRTAMGKTETKGCFLRA